MIEIRICPDCIMWHANGDLTGLDMLPETEAAARYAAVTNTDTTGHHVVVGDGEPSFSMSSCDLCGDKHGGDRLDAALLPI